MGRSYLVLLDSVSVDAAKSLIEITVGADKVVEVLRAWITQDASETSEQLVAEILRVTAAGTGTSFTPRKLVPGDAAASGSARTDLTVEGTAGEVLVHEGFNVLSGWLYVPTPEERIVVPGQGLIALKLDTAPSAAMNLSAGLIFREIG